MQFKHYFFTYLFFLLVKNCFSQSQNKIPIDLLLHHGKIYTVDSTFSIQQAIAIHHGTIIAIGSNQELIKKYSASTSIHLHDKPVYPGFQDAHAHFYGLGWSQQIVDLVGTHDWQDVLQRTDAFFQKHKQKHILGRGWDQNDWQQQDLPDNTVLNQKYPHIPVVLRRIDGHAAIANDKALELAGIDLNSHIEGGKIEIKNGRLTGLLLDNAAEAVMKSIPENDSLSIVEALITAQQECLSYGLTSISDAGLEQNVIKIIQALYDRDLLKIKLDCWLSASPENLRYIQQHPPYLSHRMQIRTVKVYADGALGSRGACLLQPYHDDPHNRGMFLTPQDTIRKIAELCYQNQYQLAVHSIGDSTNHVMLQIMSQYTKNNPDLRWRIEHAQCLQPSDFDLFGLYHIIPSVQPTHATSDMYWADERLGTDRLRYAYAYKKLLDQNGCLPLGTDFPVEKTNPLLTFYAATERKDQQQYPPLGFQPENALTRTEALHGMTLWAAYASFRDAYTGSLAVGKAADLVILDQDIMTIDAGSILKTHVLWTIIDGEIVFKKK